MFVSIPFSAQPAPLEITRRACHVIATRYFLNSCLAFGTIADISIVCSPPIKFLVNKSIALIITMPRLSTFKAHFVSTFTVHAVAILSFSNEVATVRPGTPSQVSVGVDINVLLELKILVIYFL